MGSMTGGCGRGRDAFSCRIGGMERGFQEYFFERMDEGDDALFYRKPRLVVHIDDGAIREIGRVFEELLPVDGVILDLMSSWRSHLPAGFAKGRMVGLGLNAVEMRENPQLDDFVVHDLNREPASALRGRLVRWGDFDGVGAVFDAAGGGFPGGGEDFEAGWAVGSDFLESDVSDEGGADLAGVQR